MCHSVSSNKKMSKEKSVKKNLTRSVEQKIKMHTTKREFYIKKNKTINKRLIKLGMNSSYIKRRTHSDIHEV